MNFITQYIPKPVKRFGKTIQLCLLVAAVMLSGGCSKNELPAVNPATVQIYNALNDGTFIYVSRQDERPEVFRYIRLLAANTYNIASNVQYVNGTEQAIAFYGRPDTLAADLPILKETFHFETGAIYSLFVHGSKSTADYTLIRDTIPALKPTDSVTNIRFANFSEDQVISINLKNQQPGSFIRLLPLKTASGFVELSADHTISKYEFEIRDYATETLIASFVADKINDHTNNNGSNLWYNKSNTLVFVGKKGGTGTQVNKVVRMFHR